MSDKNSFLIPALIFAVAVGITGGFLATQAQVPPAGWLRPASQGQPSLSTDGRAEIAGGAILNTGGATYGLIVASGNVGIGTTTPDLAYALDVAGKIRSSNGGFVFPDGTTQTTAGGGGGGGQWTTLGNDIY